MDIYEAADAVQANIGEPVALIDCGGYFYAVAYREEVESNRSAEYAYSTHLVVNHYLESGNYDMTREQDMADLIYRCGYGRV